ncbi:MAG: MBL fold metallo-hydrolase [Caldilineae bacterium]|nr:MAG: MBL fold metallo-hydrolase [Caldilineae bacterium]
MRRERVSDDIYVFTSSLYAQATASAIVQKSGIIVIDTLPFPEETRAMLAYLESLGRGKIRYLINSHWHGDHTFGNYLFPDDVQLMCHKRCYDELVAHGEEALTEARASAPEFEEVRLRIPDVIFDDGEVVLHVGNKSVEMRLMPGHTRDTTVAYVREDKVLIAADAMMPVPYFVAGNRFEFKESLRRMLEYPMESMVQGHGEVLLRGEIPKAIDASIRYLDIIEKKVRRVIEQGLPRETLDRISIDECGRSRIPLNGLVQDLHRVNLYAIYEELTAQLN